MTAARQLGAILAADVVGYYSRLMGANETGRANAVRERADVYADVAELDAHQDNGRPASAAKTKTGKPISNRVIVALVAIGATNEAPMLAPLGSFSVGAMTQPRCDCSRPSTSSAVLRPGEDRGRRQA
jgi:hypothetical protein